jgi:hypothetical protein
MLANPYSKRSNASSDAAVIVPANTPSRKEQILDQVSDKTRGSVNSANELFNAFQQSRYEPILEELTSEDVVDSPEDLFLFDEDDRGKMFLLLANFAFWMVENPPVNKKSPGGNLLAKTISQYFSSVKAELNRKFPKPFAFAKEEDDWYLPMKKHLFERIKRMEITGESDGGAMKCHGLYRVHCHSLDREWSAVHGAKDLRSINLALLSSKQADAGSKALFKQ